MMSVSLPFRADSRLSPKQEQAAALLAAGKGVRDTAAALQMGERTIYTWMKLSEFRAAVAEIRDAMLGAAVGKLSEATTTAVETLQALLADEESSIRLRAATGLLDALVKVREFSELALRVAEIEERLAEQEDRR